MLDAPDDLLGDRIPRLQFAPRGRHLRRVRGEQRRVVAQVEAEVPGALHHLKGRIDRVQETEFEHGQVDELRLRVVRHRVPEVPAVRRRQHPARLLVVVPVGRLDGTAGREIDVARPVHAHELLGREQFAGGAIEHVEEAVLRRLHQHLARRAIPVEVGEHDLLHRGVVPVVARRGLVVPDEPPGVGSQREDRRQVQIVAAAGAAELAAPRRAVARSDVEQVELRVVGHRVPGGAAAADLPPVVRSRSSRRLRVQGARTAATDRREPCRSARPARRSRRRRR